MTRGRLNRSIRALALAVALVVVGATSGGRWGGSDAAAQETPRPNILVIVTDDQRADLMSTMTQTLRRLGGNGTTFRRAFTPDPLCCPARASIFTGRYVHNHGVARNGQARQIDHETTIQRYLHDAGYRNGLFGKYFITWPIENAPLYFDEWAHGKIGVGHRRTNYYGGTWNLNGNVRTIDTYSTEFIRRRSLRFLRNSEAIDDDQPWFLYAAPAAPHSPMLPEKKYEDASVPRFKTSPAMADADRLDMPPWVQAVPPRASEGRWRRKQQLRMMMSVDDMVASIMRWVTTHGEGRNTLVIYTSDNGTLLGEHELIHKSHPYTESTAVPLLARWPGRFEPRSIDDRLVSLVDIAPTIAEAAGIDVPVREPMDGRSLFGTEFRDHLLIEYQGAETTTERTVPSWASLRNAGMQFVEYYDAEGDVVFREYYDLVEDPWQMENLLGDEDPSNDPDTAVLSSILASDRSCSGATSCP